MRLPRLGVYYERPVLTGKADRAAFGLPVSAHIYACPQTLFKFHPEIDAMLADILRADPAGILVLVESKYPQWSARLRQRFARTMPGLGERIRFLAPMSWDAFWQLLAVSDVMLNPIHFGGGNTSYEGFALGVPVITLPSGFLRGRLTYAMYRQMGWLDLVAANPQEYVEKAVRLGNDEAHRAHVREQLREAARTLYQDSEAVRGLEHFFWEVGHRG